jgi:hypothetical protein
VQRKLCRKGRFVLSTLGRSDRSTVSLVKNSCLPQNDDDDNSNNDHEDDDDNEDLLSERTLVLRGLNQERNRVSQIVVSKNHSNTEMTLVQVLLG